MRRQQQRVPGPGQGDVGQPPFFGQLMVATARLEVVELAFDVGLLGQGRPTQVGQSVGVATQRMWQRPQVTHPARILHRTDGPTGALMAGSSAVRGERALDQTRHRDDVPFQPLGRVHGHQLHRVGVDLGLAGVKASLAGLRRVEPGQERAQGGPIGAGGEVARHLGQCVQVGAGLRSTDARPAGDLDVEQQRSLGLDHQVGQRQCGARPQPAQRARQSLQPLPGRR